MKKNYFRVHGLLWLPFNIGILLFTAATSLGGPGLPESIVNNQTYVPPTIQYVTIMDSAQMESADHDYGELPDPEPPTEDGPWSEIISTSP